MAAPYRVVHNLADMDLPPSDMPELSAKQWRFARAYVDNPDNLKECALSAGYAESTAYTTASRLIRSYKIRRAIAAIRADKEGSARLDGDFVRRKIAAALDQSPGDGIPWREWVQVLALSARVTGLIQPGERSTQILSIGRLDGMSMDDLRRLAYPEPERPAIPADCASDCTPDGDNSAILGNNCT